MFDKYTYKQKNKFLLLVFVLLLMVTYKRAISVSMDVWTNIKEVEGQIQNAGDAQYKIQERRNQLLKVDRLVNLQTDKTKEQIERDILRLLTKKNYEIDFSIHEITPTHQIRTDSYEILTFIIKLQIDYRSLLQLVYEIEKEYKNSRIASLNIEKEYDTRNKKNNLYATLYFQNYIR